MSDQEQQSPLLERISQLENRLDDLLLLLSDVYRYGKLKDFLTEGKWQEADLETLRLMLEISGKESQDVLTPEDLRNLPINDIKVIDKLWRNYSKDKFGFSIQLHLYQNLGGNLDIIRRQDMDILRKFASQVGWIIEDELKFNQYDDWDFSLDAPVGCFPAKWWYSPYGIKMANYFFACLINSDI